MPPWTVLRYHLKAADSYRLLGHHYQGSILCTVPTEPSLKGYRCRCGPESPTAANYPPTEASRWPLSDQAIGWRRQLEGSFHIICFSALRESVCSSCCLNGSRSVFPHPVGSRSRCPCCLELQTNYTLPVWKAKARRKALESHHEPRRRGLSLVCYLYVSIFCCVLFLNFGLVEFLKSGLREFFLQIGKTVHKKHFYADICTIQ